jgi:diguanylate cyclase (GGDEF)-like protein
MRLPGPLRRAEPSGRARLGRHLTLTQQVALLTLLPIVLLGFVLTNVIERQVESHSVDDAAQSARLIANIGIQPRLTPTEIESGLNRRQIAALDEQLRARKANENLARIKIWNASHTVVYSDDHTLIGRTLPGNEDVDLDNALADRPGDAEVIVPHNGSETDSEVGLGRLVEVYVPLHFAASGRPVGAFEIYLSYRPIASAIAEDKRTIVLVVGIGLALLWAILFPIVARASRRLSRQAQENYVLAHFDPLTGLPNRRLFIERVDRALQRVRARGESLAVLLVDLDGFKEINNTLGHPTGDEVLRETGRRLQGGLGESTLLARLGGDEYAILCPHSEGVSGALRTASSIQAALEPPMLLGDTTLNVEANVGIATIEDRREHLDQLLQRADAALTRAKAQHSRIEVYSPELDRFDASRLVLLGQVREAIERDEFELHYQPKVDLREGRVCGMEALLRWRHPERGMLMPGQFVPVVERTALIGPLTSALLDKALCQMANWREHGLDLSVAVNLSARNLVDLDLPGQVAAALHRHAVPAERLTLEVTESATLLAPERAAQALAALRAIGVAVSIDDFGTGNASIGYLSTLPVDELKIDRSFVMGVCSQARSGAIVRSIVDLARNLDLRVVAEGIETEGALERLRELGCDVAQGFFVARPMPPEQLAEWLRSTHFAGAGPARDSPAPGSRRRFPLRGDPRPR